MAVDKPSSAPSPGASSPGPSREASRPAPAEPSREAPATREADSRPESRAEPPASGFDSEPEVGTVGSLDRDPTETRPDSEASQGLLSQQSGAAESLLGGESELEDPDEVAPTVDPASVIDPESDELPEEGEAVEEEESLVVETTELLPNGEILTRQTYTNGDREVFHGEVRNPNGEVTSIRYSVTERSPGQEPGTLGPVEYTLAVTGRANAEGGFDQDQLVLENDDGVAEIDQELLDALAGVELSPGVNPFTTESDIVLDQEGRVYETTTVRDAFSGDVFASAEFIEDTGRPITQADLAGLPDDGYSYLSEEEVTARAGAVRDAIHGNGTNEPALFAPLDDLPPHQLGQIERFYNREYGPSREQLADFRGDILAEFQGLGADVHSRARAEALFAGDQVLADVEALNWATHGDGFTHEATIRERLEGRTAAEIDALRERQAEVYPNGPTLDELVLSDLSGVERARIEQILMDDTPLGNAILDYELGGGNVLEVVVTPEQQAAGWTVPEARHAPPRTEALIQRVEGYSNLTPQQRADYDAVFESEFGVTFGDFLADRLSGPSANLATSLWADDQVGVLAAERERALFNDQWISNPNESAMRDLPQFESPEQRAQVEARFQENHPAGLSLPDAIAEGFNGFRETEFVARHTGDLLTAGVAQALVAAREHGVLGSGVGTDIELLRDAAQDLRAFDPAEVNARLSELVDDETMTLDQLDRAESWGGDHHVQQALLPEPANAVEAAEREQANLEWELSRFGGWVTSLGADGRDARNRLQRIGADIEAATLDGVHTPQEAATLEAEVAISEVDRQRFVEARETAGGVAKDVATGVALAVVTGGLGLTGFVGASLRALGSTHLRAAVTGGVVRATTGAAFSPEGAEAGQLIEDGFAGVADYLGGLGAANLARSHITRSLPADVNPLLGPRARLQIDAAEAVGGGALGNATGAFLDRATWEHGIDRGLLEVLNSAGSGALFEGIAGTAFSALGPVLQRIGGPGFDRGGPDLTPQQLELRAAFHEANPRAGEIQLEAAQHAGAIRAELELATDPVEGRALLDRYITTEFSLARELDAMSPGGLLPPGAGQIVPGTQTREGALSYIREQVRSGALSVEDARRLTRGVLADSDPWGPVALTQLQLNDQLARVFTGDAIVGNYFGLPNTRVRTPDGHQAASALPAGNLADRFTLVPAAGVELGLISRVGEKVQEFGPHAVGGGWQVLVTGGDILRSRLQALLPTL